MSNINDLPDDLLIKILSSIPTKDVVATCLLSKRWESLWTNVTRLEYDQEYHYSKRKGFSRFVDKSLLSHQSSDLESIHFKFMSGYAYNEIGFWIRTAINHHIRELTIECGDILMKLPLRLFTCETLVILKLKGLIDLNIPLTASLLSLQTLHIVLLERSYYGSFSRFLTKCPVLVDLMVEQRKSNALSNLNIAVPSLERLTIKTVDESDNGIRHSFFEKHNQKVEINAPSLKYLNIDDQGNDYYFIKNSPQVVEARIKASEISTKVFLSYLTSSVKRLSLSLLKHEVYPEGSFFTQLEHLEMCTYTDEWLKLLAHMLEGAVKLRVLKLFNKHSNWRMCTKDRWEPPSSVPECMMSSLETLEWKGYLGREIDKEVITYLRKHALCLKTVKITLKESKGVESKGVPIDQNHSTQNPKPEYRTESDKSYPNRIQTDFRKLFEWVFHT